MRLESALYTSRSGLDTHGKAIAVVGDNLANVSTTGFKSSRTEFQIYASGLSQQGALAEPGNGAKIIKISQRHETGSIEETSRALDAAIDGEGMFVVGPVATPTYSRAGNFRVNPAGVLVNSEEKPILGYAPNSTTLGELNITNTQILGGATTEMAIFGNIDAGAPIVTLPTVAPATFNELNAGASFVVNQDAYDSLGGRKTVTLAFYHTAVNSWSVQPYMDGSAVGAAAGLPTTAGAATTLQFGSNGLIAAADKPAASVAVTAAYSGGPAAGAFTIDLSSFSQFSAAAQVSAVTSDGKAVGDVEGYRFSKNGGLSAVLTSGDEVNLGTVVLARFPSIDGLVRGGSTLYRETIRSGAAILGTPEEGSFGSLRGGAIELSNADLASEFIDLTLYQRGYQANSQMLTSTNDLIRETIQILR